MPLARLARETDVGLRTLERWHARYRADGYAGLETASRADAGSRRLPPDLVDLIEGLALSKPRPAIATIHRKVTGICAARKWPVPSYSVVWDIVRTLDPGMVTLALEGAASYRDKHELVLRRQAELPNAMWQSDHTMLDILVVGTDGKPARPWLTAIIDDHSRVAYAEICADEKAETAIGVLRRASAWFAERGVVVERVLSDNGSCYRAHTWRDACADLGIKHKRTRPYRPQTNGKIERFHRTLSDGWAYAQFYSSTAQRNAALPEWMHFYNHHRAHSAIGGQPPVTRLTNLPGHHI